MPKKPANYYKPGYYIIGKRPIKITYDQGTSRFPKEYPRKIYTESLQGKKKELKEKDIIGITPYDYQPSISDLWALAKTAPMAEHPHATIKLKKDDPYIWMDRFMFFFEKLIEFNYIVFETLGYYDFDGEKYTHLRSDTAYKLAEMFYSALTSKNPKHENIRTHVETWANNPTDENRKNLFQRFAYNYPFTKLTPSTECPVTGQRFQWEFDGHTCRPHFSYLNKKDQDAKRKALKKELATLQAKSKLTEEKEARKNRLITMFEINGWMREYDILHLEPAVPFSKKYADPKTGEFPRVTVEIDVPTGELVFANYLSQLKDIPKDRENRQENSVNHSLGRNNHTKFHARVNKAFYVSLSNNSPTVWQNKKDPTKIWVGKAFDEPKEGQQSYKEVQKHYNDCGYICTDLWAFYACDRSRLPKEIKEDHFIVNVPPGRYRLVNHFEHKESENGIFCEISKIPKP